MAKPMFGGKKPSPKDVRNMVAAHGKVPEKLRATYRKKVIGHARHAGAMQHIPPEWMGKGSDTSGGGSSAAPAKKKRGNPFGGKQAPPFAKH